MPPAPRRRQRSARLSVAAGLLLLAAAAVVLAVPTGSFAVVSLAAASAVALGAAATRITHAELVQSRRDAALDRARLAQDYRVLGERRAAEHVAYAASMSERLAAGEERVLAVTTSLIDAEESLASTRLRLGLEARRAELAEGESAAALDAAGVARQDAEEARAAHALLLTELETVTAEAGTARVELAAARADAARAAEQVAALEAELHAARVELDAVRAEVSAWQAAPVWTRRA